MPLSFASSASSLTGFRGIMDDIRLPDFDFGETTKVFFPINEATLPEALGDIEAQSFHAIRSLPASFSSLTDIPPLRPALDLFDLAKTELMHAPVTTTSMPSSLVGSFSSIPVLEQAVPRVWAEEALQPARLPQFFEPELGVSSFHGGSISSLVGSFPDLPGLDLPTLPTEKFLPATVPEILVAPELGTSMTSMIGSMPSSVAPAFKGIEGMPTAAPLLWPILQDLPEIVVSLAVTSLGSLPITSTARNVERRELNRGSNELFLRTAGFATLAGLPATSRSPRCRWSARRRLVVLDWRHHRRAGSIELYRACPSRPPPAPPRRPSRRVSRAAAAVATPATEHRPPPEMPHVLSEMASVPFAAGSMVPAVSIAVPDLPMPNSSFSPPPPPSPPSPPPYPPGPLRTHRHFSRPYAGTARHHLPRRRHRLYHRHRPPAACATAATSAASAYGRLCPHRQHRLRLRRLHCRRRRGRLQPTAAIAARTDAGAALRLLHRSRPHLLLDTTATAIAASTISAAASAAFATAASSAAASTAATCRLLAAAASFAALPAALSANPTAAEAATGAQPALASTTPAAATGAAAAYAAHPSGLLRSDRTQLRCARLVLQPVAM